MPVYYNRTSSPLAADLGEGVSVSIPPRTWTRISYAQEGSAQLMRFVRDGLLTRWEDGAEAAQAAEAAQVAAAAVAVSPPEVVVTAAKPEVAAPVLPEVIADFVPNDAVVWADVPEPVGKRKKS